MSYESDSHLTGRPTAQPDAANASNSPPTHYLHPTSPSLQHPPVALVYPPVRSPSSPHGLDPVRLQSSISSGESSSTVAAEYKQYLSYKPFQYSPHLERGIIEDSSHRQSRAGSQHSGIPANPGYHGGTPVIEDNSAVFQYINEKSFAAEQEREDNDHALWILVRGFYHALCKGTNH
jgi:hypothetical protein